MARKTKGELMPVQTGQLPDGNESTNLAPENQTEAEVVELLKPHSHGDIDYAVGDLLTVSPPIAEWLRARGVIAPLLQDPA